ncbi:MAG: energy transducer TonB [Muribaculaceae bacterium]|nr:energy transducer TonB [Muribaculaceae bacterium]
MNLIFEGRNKEFGAYELRATSPWRHLKAILLSVAGLIIIGLVIWGSLKIHEYIIEQELKDKANQENVAVAIDTEVPEDEPEIQQIEEQKPEMKPEDVQNTVKATELNIVEDSKFDKEKEVVNQDERKEDDRSAGAQDVKDGTDDKTVKTVKEEVKITETPKEEVKHEPEKVFTAVEQMPEFPGGQAALLKFISNNIQYPQAAADNNVQGKVYVKFVVTSTGKVDKVQIARSVDKALDQEALRVCRMLPNFTPGRQNGQPVNVWYTLPVTFKLNN